MDEVTAIAKDWQTLIGAFLGFISATLIAHKMWFIREDWRQNQDAKSLAAALLAEIGALMLMCEVRKEDLEEVVSVADGQTIKVGNSNSLLIEGTDIYKANASRLGLLPDKTVLSVVIFYSRILNYNTMVKDGHIGLNRVDDMECARNDALGSIQKLSEFCGFDLETK
jgi:hypothetical protein